MNKFLSAGLCRMSVWSLLSLCLLASCAGRHASNAHDYELQATQEIKRFALDPDVRYNAFYLYTFSDEAGREYLSFLNYRANQILFYDLATCEFLFKMDLDAEGPNGIVAASGLYVKDFQNIYVSSYGYQGLIKVDTACHIVQKIPYGTTPQGYQVLSSYTPSSFPYLPPVFVGDRMYIVQKGVERFHPVSDTPLTVVIDTVRKSCEGLPLTYSVLSEKELQANDSRFSRLFNGEEFVYSFYVKEDIIVASADHSTVRHIPVKSDYIDAPAERQEDTEKGPQMNLELARYGDLIYDPYREVYYRFAYPKVTLEDDVRWWGKAVYGRKKFSVMILDKEFRVVGETLFPEAVYNSYIFFVHKDGLFISRDYQMAYGRQSEDYMTFERFELVKK